MATRTKKVKTADGKKATSVVEEGLDTLMVYVGKHPKELRELFRFLLVAGNPAPTAPAPQATDATKPADDGRIESELRDAWDTIDGWGGELLAIYELTGGVKLLLDHAVNEGDAEMAQKASFPSARIMAQVVRRIDDLLEAMQIAGHGGGLKDAKIAVCTNPHSEDEHTNGDDE
jgi:hypothetical protein